MPHSQCLSAEALAKAETINQQQTIMQNKPNFRNVQMVVTLVKTMTNNNEPRTMNYSKQTQSCPPPADSKGAPILLCGALLSPMDSAVRRPQADLWRTSFTGMTQASKLAKSLPFVERITFLLYRCRLSVPLTWPKKIKKIFVDQRFNG